MSTKGNCTPKCPMCGNAQHVRANGERLWYCTLHEMLFDDSGDDGFTTYGDPARIAVRNENRVAAAQARRKREARAKLKGGLGR